VLIFAILNQQINMSSVIFRIIPLFIILFSFKAFAQNTLVLTREQSEAIFLKENLLLIAEKLQISKAEALVLQADLWPNPVIEIDEVNLWTSQKGTNNLDYFGEELPPVSGNFGRNQQISVSVEQLILTAGKRRKLVALEQVNADIAEQYFEELLRNLKLVFRNQLTHLQYLQLKRDVFQTQLTSVRQLIEGYRRQVEAGNVPRGEYVRLKAFELETLRNINELKKEMNEVHKELNLLMRLPSNTNLEITLEGFLRNTQEFKQLMLNDLIAKGKENRPEYKISRLEENYYNNLFAYEKAQSVPDITLKGGYDRGGNFMYNFIGFGMSIDIPLFNRNQGNIRYARAGIEQSGIINQQTILFIENEIVLAYKNLSDAIEFLLEIEPGYEELLDELLTGYTKNFMLRNISLLEYLDFLDAYLENKQIILEAGKDLNEKIEELNYSVGTELIN
jgi:outer membrane protein, heavy metal efflux system